MPSHYNRVGGRGQDSMRTGSASEFRVTKEIPYGATAGTTTGGFIIFSSQVGVIQIE